MSVAIYRLRLSKGTSSSHVPDWRLYEDRDDFERDLLSAMVEAGSRSGNRDDQSRWMLQRWRRALGLDEKDFGVNKVIGAEQLIDGEWRDLKPRLIPPRVEFTA